MMNYLEILRLTKTKGLSGRQIAEILGYKKTAVNNFLQRFNDSDLGFPLDEAFSNEMLHDRLYKPTRACGVEFAKPDYDLVFTNLSKKGFTLKREWEHYLRSSRSENMRPYLYTQFCKYYRDHVEMRQLTLSINRVPGENMEVDLAGLTLFLKDSHAGENIPVPVFVAVLSYSGRTYLEAAEHMDSPSWIQVNTNALEFFDGVASVITPDNCKVAITRNADWLDPDIQQAYLEWAAHYGTAIMPARVRRPRDKSMVENAVGNVTRKILVDLREQTFFSIEELNTALWERMDAYNAAPFTKKEGSRDSWYLKEKEYLSPLPRVRFEYTQRKMATINYDSHIMFDHSYYSAPYGLMKRIVDVRATSLRVELYHEGRLVASHKRSGRRGGRVTDPTHLPKQYKDYLAWSGPEFRSRASSIGAHTHQVVSAMLSAVEHEVQAFRSCVGVLNLAKKHSKELLEQVCQQAVENRRCSYKYVRDMIRLQAEDLLLRTESHGEVASGADEDDDGLDKLTFSRDLNSFSIEELAKRSMG